MYIHCNMAQVQKVENEYENTLRTTSPAIKEGNTGTFEITDGPYDAIESPSSPASCVATRNRSVTLGLVIALILVSTIAIILAATVVHLVTSK